MRRDTAWALLHLASCHMREIEVYYVPPTHIHQTTVHSPVISGEKASHTARSLLLVIESIYTGMGDGLGTHIMLLLSMSPVRDTCIPTVRGFRHRVKDSSL